MPLIHDVNADAQTSYFRRATRGLMAMAAGSADYEQNDQQTNLADVLANLMHQADLAGLEFDLALDSARRHFEEEMADLITPRATDVPVTVDDFPGAAGPADHIF